MTPPSLANMSVQAAGARRAFDSDDHDSLGARPPSSLGFISDRCSHRSALSELMGDVVVQYDLHAALNMENGLWHKDNGEDLSSPPQTLRSNHSLACTHGDHARHATSFEVGRSGHAFRFVNVIISRK